MKQLLVLCLACLFATSAHAATKGAQATKAAVSAGKTKGPKTPKSTKMPRALKKLARAYKRKLRKLRRSFKKYNKLRRKYRALQKRHAKLKLQRRKKQQAAKKGKRGVIRIKGTVRPVPTSGAPVRPVLKRQEKIVVKQYNAARKTKHKYCRKAKFAKWTDKAGICTTTHLRLQGIEGTKERLVVKALLDDKLGN